MSWFGLMVQSADQLPARSACRVVSSLARTSTSELSGDQASGAEALSKGACCQVWASQTPMPLALWSCQGAISSHAPSGDQESARLQELLAQALSLRYCFCFQVPPPAAAKMSSPPSSATARVCPALDHARLVIGVSLLCAFRRATGVTASPAASISNARQIST